jgi:hypothetical protein
MTKPIRFVRAARDVLLEAATRHGGGMPAVLRRADRAQRSSSVSRE